MTSHTASAPGADFHPGRSNPALKHSALEDLQALLIGTLLVALAVTLFKHAGLLSGGTAGIAFLLHYAGVGSFGLVFFLINLPFYLLAWKFMGGAFTLRTLVAVALVSVFTDLLPQHLSLATLNPWLAALLGGVLLGNGFLILFRHRASLGGLGIVALIAQQQRGWRAGHVQLVFDALIVAAAIATVEPMRVAMSIMAVIVLNLVIATNHRPGRYVAH
jgi:uncharacterized membrane-anchored protein YitT (DUF2179 family)